MKAIKKYPIYFPWIDALEIQFFNKEIKNISVKTFGPVVVAVSLNWSRPEERPEKYWKNFIQIAHSTKEWKVLWVKFFLKERPLPRERGEKLSFELSITEDRKAKTPQPIGYISPQYGFNQYLVCYEYETTTPHIIRLEPEKSPQAYLI